MIDPMNWHLCIGGKRNAYRVLNGKLEDKRWRGRYRCSWDLNIKVNLNFVTFNQVCILKLSLCTA